MGIRTARALGDSDGVGMINVAANSEVDSLYEEQPPLREMLDYVKAAGYRLTGSIRASAHRTGSCSNAMDCSFEMLSFPAN